MIQPGHEAERQRRQNRDGDVDEQPPPLAREVALPLDEEAVDLALEVLDFFLHQRREFRFGVDDALVHQRAESFPGVIDQFAHVVLGELALFVQFVGNLVELGVDFLARLPDHIF